MTNFFKKKRSFFVNYINEQHWNDNVVLNGGQVITRNPLKETPIDNINLNNDNVYYSNSGDGNSNLSIDENNDVFAEQD